jgi:hypothetical protein
MLRVTLLEAGLFQSEIQECHVLPLMVERSIESVLDVQKVADLLVLLFRAGEGFDDFGLLAMKLFKAAGMPKTMAVLIADEPVPREVIGNYRRNLEEQHVPEIERVVACSCPEDVAAVITPSPRAWARSRPWLVVQEFRAVSPDEVEVVGFVRSARLDVHQVVTIPGIGDFEISEANGVTPAEEFRHPLVYSAVEGSGDAAVHPPQSVAGPSASELAVRLGALPVEAAEAETEDQQVELDERTEADLEFPDELTYPPGTRLRERLMRYRGLKSFKSSPWDAYEGLPAHYGQIFEFASPQQTLSSALSEQERGQIEVNSRAVVRLRAQGSAARFGAVPAGRLVLLVGLLRHETKLTVWNVSIRNEGAVPRRSKQQLLAISGFRHFWVSPLFSEDTRSTRYLFLRTLPPGEEAMASFIAPAALLPMPVLFFALDFGVLTYVGSGVLRGLDPCRMIIKRWIITGRPTETGGRGARVELMFYNEEDVNWFSNVPLWTKSKRRGHVGPAVSTGGKFKALFNDIARPEDTVCMSLYRRVFPPLSVKAEVDPFAEPGPQPYREATVPWLFEQPS